MRFLLMLSLPLAVILVPHTINSDTWFILNHGRYVIENGIPYTEPFTVHSGLSFIMQQWLSAVIYWQIYDVFGESGIYAFCVAASMVIGFLLYRLFLAATGSRAASFIAAEVAWMLFCVMHAVARPWIFSSILFLTEAILLEYYARNRKIIYLFPLPLLSLLLVNLHAAMWPLAFAYCLPLLSESFIARWKPCCSWFTAGAVPFWPLIAAIASMIFAGLMNPYGTDAMTYLFASYGQELSSVRINEVAPLDISSGHGKIFFALFTASLLIIARHRIPLRYLLFFAGTAFMAMTSLRLMIMFVILGLLPAAYSLKNISLPDSIPETSRKKLLRCAAASIFLCYAAYVAVQPIPAHPQKQAIDFLLNSAGRNSIHLYTGFNEGNYAEFRGIKCYMDARAEVFFRQINGQKDIMREYLDLQYGKLSYEEFLSRYSFTHAITEKDTIAYRYFSDAPEWNTIYDDGMYVLFARTSQPFTFRMWKDGKGCPLERQSAFPA